MTVPLLQLPRPLAVDANGVPRAGAKLYVYAANTSTPQLVYQDAALKILHPSPITANTDGLFPPIYTDATLGDIKVNITTAGNVQVPGYPIDNIPTDAGITSAFLGGLLYPVSANEILASVTPVNRIYEPGDIRRYGVVFDGTDETTFVNNWLKVGGNLSFPVDQTVMVTAALVMNSNTSLVGVKGAVIQTATHDINLLQATQQDSIAIRGIHFRQISAGLSSGVAHVLLDRCTNSVVENCEFEGTQFRGIWAPGAQHNIFRGNYFHDALGRGPSTSDIDLSSTTSPSQFNIIDGNLCFGGAEFGVSVWDPDSGVIPSRNVICNNRIQGQSGYGVLIYMPNAGDTFNQVIGNNIQDVTGGTTPSGNSSSGAGIYVVGAGAGGTLVANNTVVNCCISTQDESLAPGGIGISGTAANSAPITVTGNLISNMTQYHGIVATGILGGITISNNAILQPALNTTGHCIKVANSNNVSVTGNNLTQLNTTSTQRGILVFAQGANCTNTAITGNTIKGGHQSYIETVQSGGFLVSGLTISGNVCNGGDNTLIPLLLNSVSAADVMVTGNHLSGGSATVVSQTACTNVRYANNRLKGTGTAILTTSGVCTGSYYDKTNIGTGSGAGVVNGGTSLIIEHMGSAAPIAGTWAVGDRIEQSVPVVGQPKGWRCTVSGSPGTWVSEGNL